MTHRGAAVARSLSTALLGGERVLRLAQEVRPPLAEAEYELAEERVGPREPRAREGSGVVLVESGQG